MTQKDNILKELNELNSSLASHGKEVCYAVPGGYFEGLAEMVLNRIKAMNATTATEELSLLSPFLSQVSRNMPYTIPAGYFETLAKESILTTSSGETLSAKDELAALSPLLGGMKKEMPYTLPAGYFDQLPVMEHQPAKVISFTRRSWVRYAAAAVITGLIVMTGFLISNRNSNPEKALAKFEKKLDKDIEKAPDKELDEFLQQFSDAGLTGEEKASTDPNNDVKEFLKDVPEEELKEFLEETSVSETSINDNELFMN